MNPCTRIIPSSFGSVEKHLSGCKTRDEKPGIFGGGSSLLVVGSVLSLTRVGGGGGEGGIQEAQSQ